LGGSRVSKGSRALGYSSALICLASSGKPVEGCCQLGFIELQCFAHALTQYFVI
jgi:hypothetical protein